MSGEKTTQSQSTDYNRFAKISQNQYLGIYSCVIRMELFCLSVQRAHADDKKSKTSFMPKTAVTVKCFPLI